MTTKLQETANVMTSTLSTKPFASLQSISKAAAKKEEKMKKNKRSPNSSGAPAEAKKKRIVLRVRKSSKRTSSARVPNSEALQRLKDFPKDDEDMEFVTHEPIDADQELVAPEGDARKAKSSSARGFEEENVATASQEAPLVPRRAASEGDTVIHIQESPPRMEAILDDAQAVKEKTTEASRVIDDALTYFLRAWMSAYWRITTTLAS